MSEFIRINAGDGDHWLKMPPRQIESSARMADTTTVTVGDLLTTRVVETIEGWCGQILVKEEICWQGEPFGTAPEAATDANDYVFDTIKGWFK